MGRHKVFPEDTRFNFFITPELKEFLKSYCRSKRIPVAVFLRQTIEEKMREIGYQKPHQIIGVPELKQL